jgi:hypothetical protein
MEPALYPERRALVTGYHTILLRQTRFSAEVMASLGASEPGVFEERIYYGMDPRALRAAATYRSDVADRAVRATRGCPYPRTSAVARS